jgi:signal transduction histidine kinase
VALVVEPPAEPVDLRTDPVLLGHVLRNLVANALKFTDAGEVRVSATARPGGEVAISVADTGIGIAADDVARALQEWGQVDESQADRPAGSGYGLPLVRRVVDALGGRLEIDSEPGRGSTFTVVLAARP